MSPQMEDDVHFGDLLDEELLAFSNAVVHPFSDGAIGAVWPDSWQTVSLPATDRLTLDIDPSIYTGASPGMTSIIGFVAILQPRCLAAGWLREFDANSQVVRSITITPEYNVDDTVVDNTVSRYRYGPACQYSVFIAAIGTSSESGDEIAAHGYDPTDNSVFIGAPTGFLSGGFNSMAFSRFGTYGTVVDAGRVLGAGMKMWSEAPPIQTGGTVYGGWATTEDIYRWFVRDTPSLSVTSFEDIMQHRQHFQGVDGVTVRYSPLQSDKQADYVPPYVRGLGTESVQNNDVRRPPNVLNNVEPMVFDQVTMGDYVPVCLWKYNSVDTESLYSVRLEARLHIQGRPVGTSPFATIPPRLEPLLNVIVPLLSNPNLFPAAVEGHSFRSFIARLKEWGGGVLRTVKRYGPKVAQAMSLVEKYLEKHPEVIGAAATAATAFI